MSSFHIRPISIPEAANPSKHPMPTLSLKDQLLVGEFQAMASDCQILFDGIHAPHAEVLFTQAVIETWRIEHKFSRYKTGNTMDQINHAYHAPLSVDKETSALLNYADQCYQLSEGMFDITAGVLRKIWHFNGSDALPSTQQIHAMLPFIGWQKISWNTPYIQLPEGMELDLGGLGKEYAVDKVCLLLQQHMHAHSNTPVLVNFGGDLACTGPRVSGAPWEIAVEHWQQDEHVRRTVKLHQGAIATSGDSRRFLLKEGKRYSHILNPKTGVSISGAPHAISVAATNCMQAGMLSTMAMLHGEHAEAFLQLQEADFWVQR